MPCEAVKERDEALDVEVVYGHFGDGRRLCLVGLADVVRNDRRQGLG